MRSRSVVRLCDPMVFALQADPSLSEPREAQEYWSGQPIPSPGDLSYLGVELEVA